MTSGRRGMRWRSNGSDGYDAPPYAA
eukprot:COSAG06_NODE_9543_length_1874_cov_4.378028_1_plen_25_part_10